jgi:hypothetical protein
VRWSAALALGAVVPYGLARSASGSENYPAILDRQKGVDCPRPLTRCLICHDTAAGGEGSANRPFARALVEEYGLSGGKAGRELAMAIERLPDDVDTDSDGTTDQEELALCMNPSGGELSEGPGFGCSLRAPPGPSGRRVLGLAAWLLAPWLLMPALAVLRRRRPGARAVRRSAQGLRRALPLLLCACAPTEIAEDRFQSRAQTCYEFPAGGDAGLERRFTTGLVRRDGCDTGGSGSGGTGAAPSAAPAGIGSGGSSSGDAPPTPSAGGGGSAGALSGPPPAANGSDAGASGGAGGTSAAPSPWALLAGCTEAAVLEQLSRPYDMGGCTDPGGTGCHEDGTGEDPILQFPEQTVMRLLDQRDAEGCGEVWIPSGAEQPEQSFLWRRLSQNVSDEDCEIQMPLEEDPLDPQTLACMSAWILWVANGRPE